MKSLILAAILLCGTIAPLHVGTLSLGDLVKTVRTVDGDLTVWRDLTGCTVVFQDMIVDRVDLDTCGA